MRAYQLTKQADGVKPTVTNVATPTPGPGQVRIRLEAASLNYRDLLFLFEGAEYGEGRIPLSDGVGLVDELGPNVNRWKIGDRVAANFFPNWVGGQFSRSYLGAALGGSTADGVLAEAIVLPAEALVAIPSYLSAEEAATLPCAAVTAWHALADRGKIGPTDTILIQGTGGVAIFALQIAQAIGARTIVLSSSDEKLERVASLGASHGINYRQTSAWDVAVMALTDGYGATHVLELGGQGTFGRSIKAVAAGGRIAQIGVLTGSGPHENLLPLQFSNASIDGICVGSRRHFEDLNAFIERYRISPVIDKTFSFDEAPSAYSYMKSAQHFGKIVIKIPSGL